MFHIVDKLGDLFARHGHKVLAGILQRLLQLQNVAVHLAALLAHQGAKIVTGVGIVVAPVAQAAQRALPGRRTAEG